MSTANHCRKRAIAHAGQAAVPMRRATAFISAGFDAFRYISSLCWQPANLLHVLDDPAGACPVIADAGLVGDIA